MVAAVWPFGYLDQLDPEGSRGRLRCAALLAHVPRGACFVESARHGGLTLYRFRQNPPASSIRIVSIATFLNNVCTFASFVLIPPAIVLLQIGKKYAGG